MGGRDWAICHRASCRKATGENGRAVRQRMEDLSALREECMIYEDPSRPSDISPSFGQPFRHKQTTAV
jgi:hypothetical protein